MTSTAPGAKKIRITLTRSSISRPVKHRAVLKGLGLKKLNGSVIRPDTPEIRGMINAVRHLVRVENA